MTNSVAPPLPKLPTLKLYIKCENYGLNSGYNLQKRNVPETVTTSTVNVGNSDIRNTTIDSSTIVTNKEVRILEDNVLGRRNI